MGTLTNLRPRITRFNLPRVRHFAIAAALLLVPGIGSAQRLSPEFARLAERWGAEPATKTVAVFGHPDDYRWEGVLAGGIAGGVGGAVLAVGMCTGFEPDPSVGCILGGGVLGLVLGGVIGGGVGGLIGGLIPKEKPAP